MIGLLRVVGVVALLAAGCAGQQNGSGLSMGGGASSGTGPVGGAPLSSTGGAPSSESGRGCAGTGSVRITAGSVPDPVCLPVNGMLKVASNASPHQPWGSLVSSDPKILSCTSEPGTAGSVSGVCTPHLPGTVTVSTMTGAFVGDPHGPQQFRWELRVTVVAYGLI